MPRPILRRGNHILLPFTPDTRFTGDTRKTDLCAARGEPSFLCLADSHAARASVTGDPLSHLAPIAVPVRFGP